MIEESNKDKEHPDKSQQENNQTQNQQKGENKEKKTKKKKKAKQKKIHPPQYYEQKKLAKLLKKRQMQWDNRFINETIPNDISKPRRAFSSHKTNLKHTKRLLSPKETQSIYKTFHEDLQRKQKPSKSFNIRIVSKKQDRQSTAIIKKEQPQKKQEQNAEKAKEEDQRNNLIQQVNKAYSEVQFLKCHQQALIDIIKKSKQKTIASYIHAQIARIKGKTSICINLQNLVKKREECIKKLQENNSDAKIQNVEEYRVATLKVIQEILKWREQMQKVYKQQTSVKPKICFTYDDYNYLMRICKGIKPEGKFKQFSQNPFLLGFENKAVENELLVKIRACEMLLLQQQLAES